MAIRYGDTRRELSPCQQVVEQVATTREPWLEQTIRAALAKANEFALAGRVERGKYEIFRLGLKLARIEGDQASIDELSQLRYVQVGGDQS